MTWLFSQALVKAYENSRCLPGPVAAFSEENSWDGEPCAQLNVMPTQHKFWRNDKTMEFSNLSRFGLTLHLLTESRGEELLMWFRRVFLAKTCQQPGQTTAANNLDSTERKAGCGGRLSELLARLCPSVLRWKTPPGLFPEESTEFCGIWPRWGSMLSGAVYRRQPLALRTNGIASGLWLPTPTAHNAKEGNYPAERTRNTPTLGAVLGGKINPQFTEWMMGWPIGWTDLRPLGTDKFQSWLQQHGKC